MTATSEEETRLVAAASDAARAFHASGAADAADWKSFCFRLANDLYPWIDRGDQLEAIRAVLASVADVALRLSTPELAEQRLAFLLGAIRMQERVRQADGTPGPKSHLSQLIPRNAEAAMQTVWNDEDDAFRQAQHGY